MVSISCSSRDSCVQRLLFVLLIVCLAVSSHREPLPKVVNGTRIHSGQRPIREEEKCLEVFAGKVVIMTGSSQGIGRETARLFAEQGAKLNITGRNPQALEETKRLLISVGAKPDEIVSVVGDIKDGMIQKKLIEDTVEKFEQIDVMNTAFPYYAASKAALDSLTQSMALSYIEKGIRVNAVNPGWTSTTIMQKLGMTAEQQEKFEKKNCVDRQQIPMGRAGHPSEVGKLSLSGRHQTE